MQLVLAQQQLHAPPPSPATKRRLGPAKPKHSIPPEEWPNVLRRILENQEPLHKVADDYGVSHETIRRIIRGAQKEKAS